MGVGHAVQRREEQEEESGAGARGVGAGARDAGAGLHGLQGGGYTAAETKWGDSWTDVQEQGRAA